MAYFSLNSVLFLHSDLNFIPLNSFLVATHYAPVYFVDNGDEPICSVRVTLTRTVPYFLDTKLFHWVIGFQLFEGKTIPSSSRVSMSDNRSTNVAASYPIRPKSSTTTLWKPQDSPALLTYVIINWTNVRNYIRLQIHLLKHTYVRHNSGKLITKRLWVEIL
jgi:hypothetical protein